MNGKYDELKKKFFYTFLFLVIYRIAAQIPVPGVDPNALNAYFSDSSQGLFDLINTFSGGSFKRFSILALGIMPYITTSIIFSLLGEVVPSIQEMQEDSDGHRKIQKMTRYFTVLLCMIQGYGVVSLFQQFNGPTGPVVPVPDLVFKLVAIITLTAGTMFVLWLGERITEFGLENGVSLIIFAGIAVELPSEIYGKLNMFRNGSLSSRDLIIFFAVIVASLYIVTFIERSFRGIQIQYAKKVINNQVYGGSQTLPMKVDTAGVMPPILASSLLVAPATFAQFLGANSSVRPFFDFIVTALAPGQVLFNVLFSILIVYMAFFYAPIQFKTKKVSESLQKSNAFIPGIRPGNHTKEFLDFILSRLTFFGAIFLVVICVFPSLLIDAQTRFAGTSLLILVSVAIRVFLNVQTFLMADKYQNPYRASKGKYSGANKKRF